MAFMKDPCRVVRIEWRRIRRAMSAGLTSHSMLDVQLLCGSRLRFEKFCDTGLLVSWLSPDEATHGAVYRGRVAAANELVRPVREQDLRRTAEALSKPYCLLSANCHHFVRDVWNHLVIRPLRRCGHPDRIKGGLLMQLSQPLQRLPLRGCVLESRSVRSLGAKEAFAVPAAGAAGCSG